MLWLTKKDRHEAAPTRALRGRLKSLWAPSGTSNWTFEESWECSRKVSIPII